MITVVIPTVPGREDTLKHVLEATKGQDVIVLTDRDTCGAAWVHGAVKAEGDYIAFLADDLEPHPGFWDAMTEAVDAGQHPAATVLNEDGSKQSCGGAGGDVCRGDCEDWQPVEWSPTPFISREWWPLLAPHADMLAGLHYSSDCLVSAVLAKHDIPSVARRPAKLTHYNHPAGRQNRAGSDGWLFHQYRTEHGL